MRKSILMFGAVALLSIAGTASADDAKMYIGSACDFEFSSSASYSKSGHVFKNTSGGTRSATCPVVRDTNNNVEYASVEVNGGVSSARLEMRHVNGGSLVGWNHGGTVNLGSGRTRYEWFSGSTTGNAPDWAVLALEISLHNNSYIYQYRFTDN